jgi:hypothetical protein
MQRFILKILSIMKTITFLLVLLFAINGSSQAPAIQWQKSFGGSDQDLASAVAETTDGGYITAGYTRSLDGDVTVNYGQFDFWVVKMDASGEMQWQKSFGGSGYDWARDILQTTDGGFIVTGETALIDDVTGINDQYDYWILKLNPLGELQWQKTYGGSNRDIPLSIAQTNDNGYTVLGYTVSTDGDVTGNHGEGDFWILKLNEGGNMQWEKTLGGSGDDVPSMIKETNDGGYVVAGTTFSDDGDISFNHGGQDYWVAKLSETGAIQWQKSYGGSDIDEAYAIQQTPDGGYIVGGISRSTNGDRTEYLGFVDYWVLKLSADGELQWENSLGGGDSDIAQKIIQTTDGSYVIAGYSASDTPVGQQQNFDYLIYKIDASGNQIWQKYLGGANEERPDDIKQTSDGGYIIAGWSQSLDGNVTGNHGFHDFWIVKLSPDQLSNTDFIKDNFTVYPNPATSQLQLQVPDGVQIDKIAITDILGKQMLQSTENNTSINVENLSAGSYIVQAFSSDKKFQTKFIKQ